MWWEMCQTNWLQNVLTQQWIRYCAQNSECNDEVSELYMNMNLCDFQVKCQCHCKRSTDQLYVFGGVCLWMHLPAAYHMLSLGTWRVRMNRSEIKSRRMALWPALLPVTWGWCHCWHPIARSQVQCNYPPLKLYHRRCKQWLLLFSPRDSPNTADPSALEQETQSPDLQRVRLATPTSGSLSGLLHTEHQTSNIDMPGYLIYATFTNCQNHGFQFCSDLQ